MLGPLSGDNRSVFSRGRGFSLVEAQLIGAFSQCQQNLACVPYLGIAQNTQNRFFLFLPKGGASLQLADILPQLRIWYTIARLMLV